MNLCKIMYEEFIIKVRYHDGNRDIIQIEQVCNVNTWGTLEDDMVRLCILDPEYFELNDEAYFRINRIIYGRTKGEVLNLNKTLKNIGVNIYVSYNYNIEDQYYRIYYYSHLILEENCPPELLDVISAVKTYPLLEIRTDKREELNILQRFLYCLDSFSKRMNSHRLKRYKKNIQKVRIQQAFREG